MFASASSFGQENQITEVTRRGIVDSICVGLVPWSGRLDEVEFLSRLFDLRGLPSKDWRYKTASEDIWKHRVANSDWPDDWVFHDERLNILRGSDQQFLRFLCEMIHPVVRPDPEEASQLAKLFNERLISDGWEIAEATRISNRPVYSARALTVGTGVSVKAAKGVAFRLDGSYVGQQITRMESAVDGDPELAIGTAKEFLETVCKTILSERGVPYGKDEKLPKLVKLTMGELQVLPAALASVPQAAENVRVLLMNLAAIAHQLTELRNPFGTGHGKEAGHSGLEPQHARLAVGAASTLGVFLFECHRDSK